jgi:hypothetical protein
MELLYEHTLRVWHKGLSRRSRESYIPWEKFAKLLKGLPLPTPKITRLGRLLGKMGEWRKIRGVR